MLQPSMTAALALCVLALAACEKRPSNPPVPQTGLGVPALEKPALPAVPSRADPSVPSAASVVTPPQGATAKDATGARPSGNLTRAEESSAMPMSGQVNNHSTPNAQTPTRAASAP